MRRLVKTATTRIVNCFGETSESLIPTLAEKILSRRRLLSTSFWAAHCEQPHGRRVTIENLIVSDLNDILYILFDVISSSSISYT